MYEWVATRLQPKEVGAKLDLADQVCVDLIVGVPIRVDIPVLRWLNS